VLGDAGVVAQLGHQVGPAYGDDLGAEHFPDRDRPQVAQQPQRRLDGGASGIFRVLLL